jgi:hypothetical protein
MTNASHPSSAAVPAVAIPAAGMPRGNGRKAQLER